MNVRRWVARGAVVGVLAASAMASATAGASASPESVPAPAAAPAVSTAAQVATARLAGANRYETAVKISQRSFPATAKSVYVARSDVFADAIAAGSLPDGPVLLVPKCGTAPNAVISEVARLDPEYVYALGGKSSICTSIMQQVAPDRAKRRIAGANRYETAVLIAERRSRMLFQSSVKTVYVASGANNSPDAIIGGVLTDGPILTVPPTGGSGTQPAVDWADKNLSYIGARAVALGGTSTVSDEILTRFAAVGAERLDRLAGPDRYATSVAISKHQFPGRARVVYLTRGDAFADAVASGSLTDGPIFLTQSCSLPPVVKQAIADTQPTTIIALGGTSSVCGAVLREAQAAVPAGGPDAGLSEISAGVQTTCAISSGIPLCWGRNNYGQHGNGTTWNPWGLAPTPVQVSGLSNTTKISVGEDHVCAVDSGSAYCWGSNVDGQVGNPNNRYRVTRPFKVAGLTGVTDIAAGRGFTCAIANAVPYCWGDNLVGKLGNGTTTDSPVPVRVSNLSSVSAISAGSDHACAVSGEAGYCWGSDADERLGNGAAGSSNVPVRVSTLSSVGSISAGGAHTCAISGTSAYCWGGGSDGQLGLGTTADSSVPRRVPGLSGVTTLSASGSHTCAIASGAASCWGYNGFGQVGNGTTANALSPVRVTGLGTTTLLGVGNGYTCAVSTGKAYCWGDNSGDALGVDDIDTSTTPVLVPRQP